MKRLGIIGASGMARELGDIAHDQGYAPIYVAKDLKEIEAWKYSDEVILETDIHRYRDISYAVGVGDNAVRRSVVNRLKSEVRFSNLIHTHATFGKGQRSIIEKKVGVVIAAGARFTNNILIGDFNIFNQSTTIAHDVVIGDFVHIAPGCIISGNVTIGHHCWIGAGSIINQGDNKNRIHIGDNTVIGSGAVVTQSCIPDAIYVGVPARRIK